MMRTHFLRSIFLFVLVAISLPAQIKKAPPLPEPDQRYKTDILLIVAHPDDETAVASLLAKIIFDDKRKVAVVYCNRGSGGGNSYSREQSQALAAVREIEGRRSNAVLGIENVWFLDGLDTPSQSVFNSLQRWGHGKILEQIIRLIRLTRPEVIITWLPHYVAGENHGDHQAAGVIATEAFDWAADPTIFPAQMAMPREYYDISQFGEGLQAWQPKKIYYFSDASHPLDAIGPFFDVSEISPSKQAPYYYFAAQCQKIYLSQKDVSGMIFDAEKSGDYSKVKNWLSGFKLIFGKSVVACRPDAEIFAGISQPILQPVACVHQRPVKEGLSLELGGEFAFYHDFWMAHKIEHIGALASPEMEVGAGSYVHVPLLIRNNRQVTAEVELTLSCPADWQFLTGDMIYSIAPGQTLPAQMFLFAPQEIKTSREELVWEGKIEGISIGKICLKVTVKEWTLPQ